MEKKKRATNAPSHEQENRTLCKKVAELEKKIASQEDELKDLQALKRSLQHELLHKIRNGKSQRSHRKGLCRVLVLEGLLPLSKLKVYDPF